MSREISASRARRGYKPYLARVVFALDRAFASIERFGLRLEVALVLKKSPLMSNQQNDLHCNPKHLFRSAALAAIFILALSGCAKDDSEPVMPLEAASCGVPGMALQVLTSDYSVPLLRESSYALKNVRVQHSSGDSKFYVGIEIEQAGTLTQDDPVCISSESGRAEGEISLLLPHGLDVRGSHLAFQKNRHFAITSDGAQNQSVYTIGGAGEFAGSPLYAVLDQWVLQGGGPTVVRHFENNAEKWDIGFEERSGELVIQMRQEAGGIIKTIQMTFVQTALPVVSEADDFSYRIPLSDDRALLPLR